MEHSGCTVYTTNRWVHSYEVLCFVLSRTEMYENLVTICSGSPLAFMAYFHISLDILRRIQPHA